MKSLTLAAPVLVLFLSTSCSSTGKESYNNSPYGTNTVVNDQKVAYCQTTETHLKGIERVVDNWKAEAKNASGSLKEERYEEITALEKSLDNAHQKLNRLTAASAEDYKSWKADVDSAVEALDKEFEASSKSFR